VKCGRDRNKAEQLLSTIIQGVGMEQTPGRARYPQTEHTSKLRDEIASLDALIEAQARALKEKLSINQRLFELDEDARKLTMLVRSRRSKMEMLGTLSKSAATP
jgi:hypothetical protein